MTDTSTEVLIVSVTGTIVLLMMVLFGVGFILYYHRRQRENIREKRILKEAYQRELLQSQIEIQNHTLQQIGEELHDHIGQLLTVAVMRLNALEDDVNDPDNVNAVQQTRELIQTVIADVRTLSKTLDYDTVRRFGLLPSLTLELERIRRTGRVQTELRTIGEPYSLGEQAETVVLRMAQESINNALKHAHARAITVTTDYQPEGFLLTIADDGQGFDVAAAAARTLDQSGSGLGNLQRRAGLLGGNCTVDSRLGAGTRVHIRLPYPQVSENKGVSA